MDTATHYDLLIEENNDPFRDPPALQEYMCRWDGEQFLEALQLAKNKEILDLILYTIILLTSVILFYIIVQICY